MKTRLVYGLVLLLLAALTACGTDGDDGGDGVVCTLEARASVVVSIIDLSGAPLLGATVIYRVDDGEEIEAECFEPPDTCTSFVAGFEIAGDFTVRAEREGFQPAEAFVTVEFDELGCHVITQDVELTLVPE